MSCKQCRDFDVRCLKCGHGHVTHTDNISGIICDQCGFEMTLDSKGLPIMNDAKQAKDPGDTIVPEEFVNTLLNQSDNTPIAEILEQAQARYQYACHAMQTGVAYMMGRAPSETQPKHLRVGVNASMRDHAALVRVLVSKGIITELEYYVAMADEMEREVKRYEDRLNKEFKANVKLV